MAITRVVKQRWQQIALLSLVYLWIWLEVNRWFATITTYQVANSGFAYLGWLVQHFAVDFVSFGAIWLVVRKMRT
jgi:hypothetical protein